MITAVIISWLITGIFFLHLVLTRKKKEPEKGIRFEVSYDTVHLYVDGKRTATGKFFPLSPECIPEVKEVLLREYQLAQEVYQKVRESQKPYAYEWPKGE